MLQRATQPVCSQRSQLIRESMNLLQWSPICFSRLSQDAHDCMVIAHTHPLLRSFWGLFYPVPPRSVLLHSKVRHRMVYEARSLRIQSLIADDQMITKTRHIWACRINDIFFLHPLHSTHGLYVKMNGIFNKSDKSRWSVVGQWYRTTAWKNRRKGLVFNTPYLTTYKYPHCRSRRHNLWSIDRWLYNTILKKKWRKK